VDGLDSKKFTSLTHLGFWKRGAQKPFQKSLLLRKKLSTNSLWPIHRACIRFITAWYTGPVTTSGFCIIITKYSNMLHHTKTFHYIYCDLFIYIMTISTAVITMIVLPSNKLDGMWIELEATVAKLR
jgi:hypothetical protein